MDLMYPAQHVHRAFHAPNRVQMSTLLSIKTGGCPEDCGYCPQSIHYDTGVARDDMLPVEAGGGGARAARRPPARRASAWARPSARPRRRTSSAIATMIREVGALGLETCATLGMLTPEQAQELKDAGLDYYNHNVDSSEEFYRQDHHDAHLPAPARHARSRAQCGPEGVQRRHRRHGRNAHRSRRHAGDAGEPAGASAERADQPAGAGEGHAAGRWAPRREPTWRRWFRVRAHHCRGAHPDAAGAGAAVRRPRGDERRAAGAGLHGRRELDLLRREAADHGQSGCGARSRAARAPEDRIAKRSSRPTRAAAAEPRWPR